jgi:negative regulator of replication initiation
MLEVCRDHHIDVLFLTETWHDADSLSAATKSLIGRDRVYATM